MVEAASSLDGNSSSLNKKNQVNHLPELVKLFVYLPDWL
jgi:hypothetical protein